jgi:dTDP-4-amino-4,6-dideoxygalactose transaminase
MDFLKARGIMAVFHYLPLHLSAIGRTMEYKEGDLPVTEAVSGQLLRLPFYFELRHEDQAEVIQGIKDFFN